MEQKALKKLVSAMSLEEKALQLTQYPVYELDESAEAVVTGLCDLGGIDREALWRTGTILNAPNGEKVQSIRKTRREKGIADPLPFMLDVIHGYRTIYPVPLAMACTFNLKLIEDCAELAATEARYDGVDVTFSPMVDLGRDARWGRVMEGAGEDPYWSGEVGKAMIRGYHRGGIACCVKHFAGYGAAEAGREYNTTDISERNLREYYLRAYRACLEEQPELFMSSFNLLNGKPILGHKEIMLDLLRKEWGFDGVVISDFGAVEELHEHGYCETGKDCASVALSSGLDIEMGSSVYASYLPELVRTGVVSEEQIDEAVLRVLELKNKLGMYENPERNTDLQKRAEVTLSESGRALSRRAVEEGSVLLKNNGVLRLTMTGAPVSMDCTIESFTWGENDGTKDINFTLEFKEYRKVKVKTTKKKEKVTKKVTPAATERAAKEVKSTTYTVVKGDNLSKIAKNLTGSSANWQAIYNQNKGVIGGNPNLIYPGQQLVINV